MDQDRKINLFFKFESFLNFRFGDVYKGKYRNAFVAVKTIDLDEATERSIQDFSKELKLMLYFSILLSFEKVNWKKILEI